jgi:ATP-dependent DNA helicase RecG
LDINETENTVVELLMLNPKYKAKNIVESIGKSVKTIFRAFESLQSKGYIKRIGSKRNGYWKVLKDV